MGKKFWYSLISITILAASVFIGHNILNSQNGRKEEAMIYELAQLRDSVHIYVRLNKVMPESLAKVVSEKYTFKTPTITAKLNEKGDPVDPFGNPYQLDISIGWVRSSTPGYQSW